MAETKATQDERPKTVGRRSKLTPEVHDEVVAMIASGGTYRDAYEYACIGETTFYRWMVAGEKATKPDNIYRKFWEGVKKADLQFKEKHRRVIEKAGTEKAERTVTTVKRMPDGQTHIETKTEEVLPVWTASAWLLERRFPDEYGQRQKIEHSGEIDTPGETEVHLHFVPTEQGKGEEPAEGEAT